MFVGICDARYFRYVAFYARRFYKGGDLVSDVSIIPFNGLLRFKNPVFELKITWTPAEKKCERRRIKAFSILETQFFSPV